MFAAIDKRGRVLLPREYLAALHLKEKEEIEITLQGREIILKKKIAACLFCHAAVELVKIDDLYVCRCCIERIYHAKDREVIYGLKID